MNSRSAVNILEMNTVLRGHLFNLLWGMDLLHHLIMRKNAQFARAFLLNDAPAHFCDNQP